MPKMTCPAFWSLSQDFLDNKMYIRKRTESERIILHPYPKQEEIEQGLWVTGEGALQHYCHYSSPTTHSRRVRLTQCYSIADSVRKDQGKSMMVETKEGKENLMLDYREILTPDLLDPISKLRNRGGGGKSWTPDVDTQTKILIKVLNHVYDFGKITNKDIKFYIESVVSTTKDSDRDKIKRSLQQSYPDEIKEVGEILRKDKPYMTENEVSEFAQEVIYSSDGPTEVFVENKYIRENIKVKIPRWIVIGLESTIEDDSTVERVIWTILGEYLEDRDINLDNIKDIAKSDLKNEWGI